MTKKTRNLFTYSCERAGAQDIYYIIIFIITFSIIINILKLYPIHYFNYVIFNAIIVRLVHTGARGSTNALKSHLGHILLITLIVCFTHFEGDKGISQLHCSAIVILQARRCDTL